ncbi:hypothetical protein A0128_11790 [Leptospira tipperaryensis]|uniref:SH3b domain-containing protein n=1 Tax=Leptospira tipperaryensis TaxID=2564040 RepID=A0A1D7UY25_9LEPT|nr:hypothetical protein [Leptospira tipperaryensis]AOP34470.1 hypothetical protein A0128_11790 [Leptospira tipperaryensis]
MQIRRITSVLFLILASSISSSCSFFKSDCRKTNSCPVTFMVGFGSGTDLNGEHLAERVPKGARILVLVDYDGEIQNARGKYGSLYTKCLWNGKEVFLSSNDLSYNKKIRVFTKSGILLQEKPDPNSKLIGELSYNTSVRLIDEIEPSHDLRAFIKVTNGILSGWAKRDHFTDGDYDAGFYRKPLKALLENFSLSVKDEENQFNLAWKGIDFQSVECKLRETICFVSMKFGKATYGEPQEAILFEIKSEEKAGPEFLCEIRKIDVIDSFQFIEGDLLSPFAYCERTMNADLELENSFE